MAEATVDRHGLDLHPARDAAQQFELQLVLERRAGLDDADESGQQRRRTA
jgi:hypothetical protein